ncbi:LA_3751/LA_3752 family putative glycosyltransferase [Leptospira kmetyi]|uniref:LA_3751/LA_3752 family putative glycosyltransferase n=1 Tax=Leptospira kmetyi TaxID=408139 RepID=UPI003EBF6371
MQKVLYSLTFKLAMLILIIVGSMAATNYTKPDLSFTADSLIKVLQAKGWVENDFQSQEVFYLGKRIDPDFLFFPIKTISTKSGEKIGPFPIANTLITVPFVLFNEIGWLIYFCSILFCLYLVLLYALTKRILVPIAGLLATPLFHHFISFSDVAVAAFLVLIAILFISRENSIFSGKPALPAFLSGLLIGLSCWFRPEALILFICLTGCAALVKFFSEENRLSQDWKQISVFLLGFIVVFSTFILYNFLNYDSLLGPRVASNEEISDLNFFIKFSDIQSLLVAGNGRLGFFGFSPWYLFLLLFGFLKWKSLQENTQIWILTFCTNLIAIGILTPNDSNIDWGSRYLTCSVFIPLLLLNEIKFPENTNKAIRNSVLLGFGILLFYSINVNMKAIQIMRKIAIQLDQIQTAIPWNQSKIFITRKIHIANTFGLKYLSQTILLVKKSSDLDEILQSHREGTIVLIEDPFDKSLSTFVKRKFPEKFNSREIPNPANKLLHLVEISPKINSSLKK